MYVAIYKVNKLRKNKKNSMVKCITFDFDGTIVDTKLIFADLYNSYLSERYGGRKVVPDDYQALKQLSLIDKIRFLRISPIKIPLFIKAARKEVSKRIETFPLFDGIEEVLQNLKDKGYTIAIISTNHAKNIRRFLALKKIDTVDHVYSDIGASLFVKSRTIKRFLRKSGISNENFVYVGDEVRDIEACRDADVKVIAVTWGWDPYDAIEKCKPDFIAHEPKDIEVGIEKLISR